MIDMMFRKATYTLLLSLFLAAQGKAQNPSQWPENGLKAAPSQASQLHMDAVSDGRGGVFFVYEENVSGDLDIRAQWVDGSSHVRWGSSGISVASSAGNQTYPSVSPDGSGGIVVAWQDESSGDVYAQHLGPAGERSGPSAGTIICSASGEQSRILSSPDGAGGAVFVWVDRRNGSNTDIYAQRMSAAGLLLWASNGVPVTTATGNQSAHCIVGDGAGGVVVVWQDTRNGFTNTDLFAQALNGSGLPRWTVNGVSVVSQPLNQYSPVADTSGGRIVVVWSDSRSGGTDVYAQALNQSGAAQWTAGGIPICNADGTQLYATLVPDGSGGAVFAWADDRNGYYDIYAQRVGPDGSAHWAANGLAVNASQGYQYLPALAPDGAGGATVVWNDNRSGSDIALYAQHIDENGSLLWESGGISVADTTGTQSNQVMIPDGSGGALVLWQDGRDDASDAYAQLLNSTLAVTSPAASALWGGGIAHTLSWTLRSPVVLFDRLDLDLSVSAGDGYPVTILRDVSADALTASWTPQSVTSTQCRLRIQAKDSRDSLLCTFTSGLFTIDSDPPVPFSLLSPVNGSVTERTPVFTWQATEDAVSGLDHYELWLDGLLLKDRLSGTSCAIAEQEKLSEGGHTWAIHAVDGAGQIRSSSLFSFRAVEDTTAPAPFHLLSPAHDSWTSSVNPLFQWETATDNESGIIKYVFYLDGQVRIDSIPSGETSTQNVSLSGTHTWTVAAVDSFRNVRMASETRTVHLDNCPPKAFSLISPTTNAWTGDSTPVFTWAATSDSGSGIGMGGYELWIDNALCEGTIPPGSSVFTLPPGKTLNQGTHTWFVKARDLLGNSRVSKQTFILGIDLTSPDPVSLLSPADLAFVRTGLPELAWNPSADHESGLAGYTLHIDGAVALNALTATSARPAQALSEGIHTWQVSAMDKASNSTVSSTRSFTVDSTGPQPFLPISPNDGAVLHVTRPTFSWHSTSDPVSKFDRFQFYLDGTPVQDGLSAEDTVFTLPGPLQNGNYRWKACAWDHAGNFRMSATWTFTISCNPPSITSPEAVQAVEDIAFSYTASASDPDGDPVRLSFSGFPAWLDTSGVMISGIPREGTPSSSFQVTADDGMFSITRTVSLQVQAVNDAPVITSSSSATATEHETFTYQATADDPEEDDLAFTFTGYPAWLSPSGSRIQGMPPEGAVSCAFAVIVSDGLLSDTLHVWLALIPVNDAPVFTSTDCVSATEDILFQYTAEAMDPEKDPLAFTFRDFPSWMTPSGACIAGTPVEGAADTSFTVTVSDGALGDTLHVFCRVAGVNDPPQITSPPIAHATEDLPFSYTASAADPEHDSLSYAFRNVPSWLVFSGKVISGVPTEGVRDTSFTLIVSDGLLSDTLDVDVTVTAVNDPPVLVSAATAYAVEDTRFVYRAEALDPDGPGLTFSFSGYPSWLEPSGMEITGIPREGCRDTQFRLVASDGLLSDTLTVQLLFTGVNDAPYFTYAFPNPCFQDLDSLRWQMDLDDYAEDPDDPDSVLVWSYAYLEPQDVTVRIENATHIATLEGRAIQGKFGIAFTVTDPDGASAADTLHFSVVFTLVEENRIGEAPKQFVLENNYPNPFNPVTHIRYGIPKRCRVTLLVINMIGQEVTVLLDEVQNPGMYDIPWDASSQPSGVYFLKFRGGDWTAVKRMALIK